jgi:ABC-type glycerol-3-phosphate transport system substrate-binding protein
VGSTAGIPLQEGVFADLESRDEWTVLPFLGPGGRQNIEVYGPSFFVLRSSPKEQLAAWLLVRWLVSPQNQARLAQANAWLPVRDAGLKAMDRLPATYPQWAAAASLLAEAATTVGSEPPYRSWRTVRWALSDATTQLFRYYFTIDQVSQLVELLERTASEFHP